MKQAQQTISERVHYTFCKYECALIGDRTLDGLKTNVNKEIHCGGVPPLGYRLNENKKLAIDAKEAKAIQQINKYFRGYGYGKIAAELNDNGCLTKQMLKFKKNSIHDILVNG